ncbi:MAG: Nramp family divalent metal transporter [Gammaproteobacteria bacterium]|jgi:Mn2+/Fe2+ NRAMP family transporter|nr:Nramp family divalent metal transporter [Gammaproteobacteria bacterium]
MNNPLAHLRHVGPGLVIAATGLGAGDLIAASVAGAKFGTTILWAAVLGAIMKYVMNEGLTRWQLATGTTLLEGWVQRLPKFISIYFFVYLLAWSFIVAGALIAGTGLAAHALFPEISVEYWGIFHSLLALALVLVGRYTLLEHLMKIFMGLMLLVVIICAALVAPGMSDIISGLLIPSAPEGSVLFIFSVIGGVGGSVTLLCYGYWIRERDWNQPKDLPRSRVDLTVAYVLTGLFGVAIMIISAGVHPDLMTGPDMALGVANQMEKVAGPFGKWCFLIGFWCAVFSSMLGVWQGIPYLYADFVQQYTYQPEQPSHINTRSTAYRGYLVYLALPPMLLLLVGKPVWLVIMYAVAGAFFMPLLCVLLLLLNNRRSLLGDLKNGLLTNLVLLGSVILFGLLLYTEAAKHFG